MRVAFAGMLTAALLAAGVAGSRAEAAASPSATAVRTYVAAMGPHIKSYRVMLTRADRAFDDVSTTIAIQRFERSKNDFKQLAARISRVRPPSSLARKHRNLVTAMQLVSKAFGGFAEAQRRFQRDRNAGKLIDANTRARSNLPRAEKLQYGWASAVRASARRARVAIPTWLQEFVP